MTAEEVAWLEEGHAAEIAAIRPARLMRAIYQGFARANQLSESSEDADGDFVGTGFYVWGYDGGADVVAADSFG
jgi:hypothetical protein